MEVVGVVKDGKVELPASVHLPERAEVRVIVSSEALVAATEPSPARQSVTDQG